MKSKVEATFYCYLDAEGMQKQVLKPAEDDTEDLTVEEQGAREKMQQPLTLTALLSGIWTGKKIHGDVSLCKDEVHDLLNAEGDGLRALFVLELKDN